MKVLHVAAEIFPLVKTGGLADVTGAILPALNQRGIDARIVLPGLPAILDGIRQQKKLVELGAGFGAGQITIRQGRMPVSGVQVYIVDAPWLYVRDGNPYIGADGQGWPDNARRFALLSWVAAHMAFGEFDPFWKPAILHAHDWHAGLSLAYLAAHPAHKVKTAFTIHNLAYQGHFDLTDRHELGLSSSVMGRHGVEFHGQGNFMKTALTYADRITTVSPRYAQEICTPEFGCGLDGLLNDRRRVLSGILNGVDYSIWDPSTDRLIDKLYSARNLSGKAACKAALQSDSGLTVQANQPLFAVVSRLTDQKGIDLVLSCLPELVRQGGQLIVLGTGEKALEERFTAAASAHPGHVSVKLDYDETRAHRIIAAADVILVPSRFEPCGLTQLYALRYGTLPLVRKVGGLSDTVADTNHDNLQAQAATGFTFEAATSAALSEAIRRAISTYADQPLWQSVMERGMNRDYSWEESSKKYLALYRDLLE